MIKCDVKEATFWLAKLRFITRMRMTWPSSQFEIQKSMHPASQKQRHRSSRNPMMRVLTMIAGWRVPTQDSSWWCDDLIGKAGN